LAIPFGIWKAQCFRGAKISNTGLMVGLENAIWFLAENLQSSI
jgi:hypothetical protein